MVAEELYILKHKDQYFFCKNRIYSAGAESFKWENEPVSDAGDLWFERSLIKLSISWYSNCRKGAVLCQ